MKFSAKYKIYLKSKKIIDTFPKRIFDFHRTKWKRFKRNYKLARRFYFINFSYRSVPKSKKSLKMKHYYKESLNLKTQVMQIFDNSFNSKLIKEQNLRKKNLLYQNSFGNLIIKHLYRLDILLWKLCFFNSVLESQKFINNKKIKVNDKFIKSNYFLKGGDIINLNSYLMLNEIEFEIEKIFYRKFQAMNFYSFIECDFYVGTIIITKDYEDLTLKDYSLIFPKSFNSSKFYNYIR